MECEPWSTLDGPKGPVALTLLVGVDLPLERRQLLQLTLLPQGPLEEVGMGRLPDSTTGGIGSSVCRHARRHGEMKDKRIVLISLPCWLTCSCCSCSLTSCSPWILSRHRASASSATSRR